MKISPPYSVRDVLHRATRNCTGRSCVVRQSLTAAPAISAASSMRSKRGSLTVTATVLLAALAIASGCEHHGPSAAEREAALKQQQQLSRRLLADAEPAGSTAQTEHQPLDQRHLLAATTHLNVQKTDTTNDGTVTLPHMNRAPTKKKPARQPSKHRTMKPAALNTDDGKVVLPHKNRQPTKKPTKPAKKPTQKAAAADPTAPGALPQQLLPLSAARTCANEADDSATSAAVQVQRPHPTMPADQL